jgi:hypothetical protein
MAVESAKFLESGDIQAVIDGQTVFVPNNPANRMRQQISEWEAEGNTITPWTPPPLPVPESISDRQFFQQLAIMDIISQAEAIAAVATGTLPAIFVTAINALPENQQFSARMLVQGATTFNRNNQFVSYFAAFQGMTSAQVDDLWRNAAEL